jgi:hypothetical protein
MSIAETSSSSNNLVIRFMEDHFHLGFCIDLVLNDFPDSFPRAERQFKFDIHLVTHYTVFEEATKMLG